MADKPSDQKGRPAWILRCAVLILVLLVLSLALCSRIASAAGQVRPTMKREVEKKATQHSTCYAVQVGAYKKRAEAGAMLDKLARAFLYRMMLTQVGARDNVRWRLRVLATSKVEALQVSERLSAEQGIEAWILPMPCTDLVEGRLDHAILTLHTETPEPASPARMKEAAPSSREVQVSTPVPKTERAALPNEQMVWMMTIATFLDTGLVVFLICVLYLQREQIRQAFRGPWSTSPAGRVMQTSSPANRRGLVLLHDSAQGGASVTDEISSRPKLSSIGDSPHGTRTATCSEVSAHCFCGNNRTSD